MRAIIDRVGQEMGRMKVLSYSYKSSSGNSYWHVECTECGYCTVAAWKNKIKGHGCKSCHGREQMRSLKYRENRGNDLYMIQCGPYIKIGVTDNIDKRLSQIRSSNPMEVNLVGLWKGEGHREEHWHREMAHAHVRGEWFKIGGACEI